MNSNYKPMKSLVRATFAAGDTTEPRFEKVDREAKVLHGVQITLEGEALGHHIWLDRQFCQDVVNAGNQRGEAGVKVRFGHPAMCSDALGTYLGRAKNFRLVDLTRKSGEAAAGVLADVYLDENADRCEWILNMAESAPDTFGQSIVFTYADTKYVDAEGVWHLMSEEGADLEKSADGKEYAVLGVLHGTDFTDTPAATDGVFSADDLAAEAAEMLDQHPELSKVQGKNVIEFLTRIGREDILTAFENARVAGLQKHEAEALKAKDSEIEKLSEEWSTKMTKLAEERDALKKQFDEHKLSAETAFKAAAEELAAAKSQIESLTADLTTKTEDLSKATAELDAKAKALTETEKALSERTAALEVAEKRYQDQVAPALGHREDTFVGDAREHLAKLPLSKRAAFYKAHKSEIDK